MLPSTCFLRPTFLVLVSLSLLEPLFGQTATTSAPAPSATPAAVAEAKAPIPRTPESAITPEIKNRNRHEQFLYRRTQGPVDLLFLGDSITDNWSRWGEWTWLKFVKYNPANFGISGDRTEHLLWRILNGELDGINPKVTVIMIGTNNVGHSPNEKPEWAAEGVKKIVSVVHEKLPNTKVLLLGVFPRATKGSDLRNAVTQINEIISKLDDGKTTRYLDIGDKFLDANGEIPADVMPDKLHPSPKGYEIWYTAMQPLLDQMMAE
jgi:lysophospholipase L1-like esterase